MDINENRQRGAEASEADRITVVAIDDHPTYVQGLATLLEAAAEDIDVVAVASCPKAGIDLVIERSPQVVLVDLYMPAMDGIEVTERIVTQAPNSKVLVLTASDEPAHVAEVMRVGARGYLSKLAEPQQLISAVRAVAAGEIVLAPFAARALFSAAPAVPELTEQEMALLRSISTGASYAEVAFEMAISESTLKRQLADIQRKLNVDNKFQAVAHLARRGLL